MLFDLVFVLKIYILSGLITALLVGRFWEEETQKIIKEEYPYYESYYGPLITVIYGYIVLCWPMIAYHWVRDMTLKLLGREKKEEDDTE